MISLDTTRADHLGCYGYRRVTSPHLDRFAAGGAIFEDCFSTHIPTQPAHTCMMTGRDPFATGVIAQGGRVTPDEARVSMLAQRLQQRGYFTVAADNLGRWFSRGFDRYEGYAWPSEPGQPPRKGEAVNTTAVRLLRECAGQDQPFFAFFHYWDPHTPYLPPPPFDRMFYTGNEREPENPSMDELWEFEPFAHYFADWMPGVTDVRFPAAQYDASIAYLDACLAHLFQEFQDLGLQENTAVVITADHGEEMDEHQCWFDHHGLYDTNVRVPLIVRCPGSTRAGQRIPGFVRTLDITPSLLEIAGLATDEDTQSLQGYSFLPMLKGAASPVEELYLTECTWMRKRALRNQQFKYIQALEPDIHGKPPEELYDLQQDPGETLNLAALHSDLCRQFRQRLEEWSHHRQEETGNPDPLRTQPISLTRVGNPETPVILRPGSPYHKQTQPVDAMARNGTE